MDIVAVQRFARVSPKKMRPVSDVAKKLTPSEAVEKLPFLRKSGAEVLLKVIKSAIANAHQKGLGDTDLVFKEIQIGEGPRLKRGRAASRGRWHPYKRRMSHVRVVLSTKELKDKKSEKQGDKNVDLEEEEVKESSLSANKDDKPASKPAKSVGSILKSVISKKGVKAQKNPR